MKETIAFPQLVRLVAEKANTTERMSELFLQELFALVTQELTEGKSVMIKGVGIFKVAKNESGKDVAFTPDKVLAEAVNAPFAQFVPVELCAEVTDEMLSEIDAAMEQPAQEKITSVPLTSEDDIQNVVTEPVSSEENTQEGNENVGARDSLSTLEQQEPQESQESQNPQGPLPQDTKSRNPLSWVIAAAVAVLLIATWYFFTHRSKERSDKGIETTHITKNDTTPKSAKPQTVVTDTLGGNNVIFTMAKKHYGDQAFWVYIARENQAQFPDYRKIPSGAVLVIPPASKYGINSDSKQSIKQAGLDAMKLYKEVKAAEQNVVSQDSASTINSKNIKITKQSQRTGNSKKHSRHYRSSRNKYHRRR